MRPPASVSIVVPAHNSAKTLPALLDALKRQTVPPLEVIVVDDASSDATAETARAGGARLVRHGENRGPGEARNSGARAAAGDVLAFTDADCVPPPDWLERGLDFMARRGLRASTAGYLGPVEPGLSAWFQHWEKRFREPGEPAEICATNGHSLMIERKLYLEAGGMPAIRTSEDFLFGFELSRSVPIHFDPANGVYHNFRPGLCGFLRQKMLFAQNGLVCMRAAGRLQRGRGTFRTGPTALALLCTAGALACAAIGLWRLAAGGGEGGAWLAAALGLGVLRGIPFFLSLSRRDFVSYDGGPAGPSRHAVPILLFPYSLFYLVARDVGSMAGILRGLWLIFAGRTPDTLARPSV